MPFPFELEGKGGFEFLHKICGDFGVGNWIEVSGGGEGVNLGVVCNLEPKTSPSPRSPSSTLSSALAGVSAGSGGGSTGTVAVATVSGDPSEKWPQGHPPHQQTTSVEINSKNNNLDIGSIEKCGLGDGGLEYWDGDLLETGSASPGQDHSILRLIMGDVEDPSMGLNKLLHPSVSNQDFHFNAGGGLAGMLDQGFGFDPNPNPNPNPSFSKPGEIALSDPLTTPMLADLRQSLNHQPNPPIFGFSDDKAHVLSHPQLLISQLQAQNPHNPAFFLPLLNTQLDQMPPPSKRHNSGLPIEMQHQHRSKFMNDEMGIQQQAIVDQLYKAAELVQTGNPILAQEILARLNHQLSPIGKPFLRVAFYFKEALQMLINNPLNNPTSTSPYNTLFKIGAYKSFSEMSPLVQFANFTCNQALLESLDGFERIRIVDFDIGYGTQWASLMQELALRKRGPPSLKITVFASPTTHDELELGLTRESLNLFAQELNINLEFETISLDYLTSTSSWSMPFDMTEDDTVVVNLPISSFCNLPISPSMVLGFIKQLSPRIVVTVDRDCDRMDLPFAHHTLQAFQSYLVLLESLDDAANISLDALQKIEAFLIRPGIEKLVLGHHVSPEKLHHWKTMFLAAGFSPVSFSNFTECQAEWLLKRTIARGFHVEKRQSSLVLYWQRKELIAASAWRC